jgi:hypothetical protein
LEQKDVQLREEILDELIKQIGGGEISEWGD